jgi:hypothetical protein
MKKLTTLVLLILECHCYAGIFTDFDFYCIDGYRYVQSDVGDGITRSYPFVQMFQLSPDKQSSVPVQCKQGDEVVEG